MAWAPTMAGGSSSAPARRSTGRPRSSDVGSRRAEAAIATTLDDLGGDDRFQRCDMWWRRERNAFARVLS
jgi:hypothetical protein